MTEEQWAFDTLNGDLDLKAAIGGIERSRQYAGPDGPKVFHRSAFQDEAYPLVVFGFRDEDRFGHLGGTETIRRRTLDLTVYSFEDDKLADAVKAVKRLFDNKAGVFGDLRVRQSFPEERVSDVIEPATANETPLLFERLSWSVWLIGGS